MNVLKRTCSVLLLLWLGAAAQAASTGYERIERFLNGLQGMEAQFQQTLSDRTGQVTDRSTGVLAISRPNRFRWDYKEPYQQVIVSDGVKVWLYDSDLQQVTVRKLDNTLSATPAMLLSGEGKLEENFKVTENTADKTIQWVRMEPKRNDTDFKWVRLGFSGDALRYMELGDKLGQTTTLQFSKFERNPRLDPARFVFQVPEGADVIGDAGTGAPKQ
jgi:outer membrane lipoprotein carrier protein